MLLVGIDLVEIEKIKNSMKNPRFCRRVLGAVEYSQLEMRGFPIQSVAASFSAKEAFSKALGTGLRGFALGEVELLRGDDGKPSLCLSGRALKIANGRNLEFSVSVTHTRYYAAAVVVGQEAEI
jgi:holo-[acyl-carrier protein] synthase